MVIGGEERPPFGLKAHIAMFYGRIGLVTLHVGLYNRLANSGLPLRLRYAYFGPYRRRALRIVSAVLLSSVSLVIAPVGIHKWFPS